MWWWMGHIYSSLASFQNLYVQFVCDGGGGGGL